MNNKKILALILAFAMMFSSITVAFADTTATIGADAAALKNMGVMLGDDGGVTPEYLAKETTRMQAAIMYLRLAGLEDEAKAFTGTANFADANTMTWGEGKAIMAYLKANPQLGWVGADAGKFEPLKTISAQQYYKVMLEALGYKQTTATVVGDFSWNDVITFAASKGLVKVANAAKFTNNDVAVATIETLKTNVKAEAKTLATVMVDAGMINKAAAIAAGLYVEVPTFTGVVKSAKATGNTAVEVEFTAAIEANAGNAALYTIEGLAVSAAVVTGEKTVVLTTAAQTTGSLYTMTVGEKSVKFAGIAKVSDGPQITESKSEDVEEVILTFDRNIDITTGTNVANYTIAGVKIVKAEVDENVVTLTTEGLKNKTSYTVKAANLKSIDLVTRKTTSDTFRSNYDTAYPRLDSTTTLANIQTNQRILVYFNEEVTEASAENIANYSIKVNETDGAELEIISATWDSDDENFVTLVTEPMEKNESYKLSVNNIADQRKVANVMTRPATLIFKGVDEDNDAPTLVDVKAISKSLLTVEFDDDSRIDETSALDVNNYTFKQGSDTLNIEAIETLTNENGTFKALVTVEDMEAGKKYDLEVVDVTDEFGNAMKADEDSVTPSLAVDFASAKLSTATISAKDTIILTFDKELIEASAENIANYSIDGGIGTPLKATLGDDDKTVTLKVNELTNGVKYDLTVNGVQDLAGHILNFIKKDIPATGAKWDIEVPELEDAYAVNKYVVALEFSEEVEYAEGTELWLTVAGTVYDESNPIVLTAKASTEDDTVIEFSDFAGGFVSDDAVNYTVYKVVYEAGTGVTDIMDNPYVDSTDEFTFDGSSSDADYAEVDSYDQVNGGTFDVTFTKDVQFIGGGDSKNVATTNGKGSFTVTIDDNVVSFVGTIAEDVDYEFNLAALLEDEHGIPVVNSDDTKTILTGEETDSDKPYITNVEATDRLTIEIEFSEDIKTVAKENFKLKNVDTEKNITITNAEIDDDKNVVVLTLSTALEGRYEYELTMSGNVVVDYANLKADADTFTFDGTDLAQ